MRYQLQAGPAFGPGLMLSALETFTAGGYIGVADTEANAPWFYADRSWKQDRVFHVLTDVQHIHEGDFDGAVSQATGTARVDDPYAYTGTWSHRWTDADGDGYAEQLQLVWKADGTPISRVDPELAGELAVNSLWSSASNAAALGGNVLSRLSVPRLTDRHARNLWGMGLGDFARQRSRGGVDGYDYNGGGYSVGADSGMGGEDKGIWGSPSGSSAAMPEAGISRGATRRTPGWAPCTGDA
ncbi:autotransporter outer membrane beta-barrel domain-containing protein [Akkermansia muciniphila]|nr:autotransporter outer membrane beta-barrel domain-containing protein [Akkermansia muciniphila]